MSKMNNFIAKLIMDEDLRNRFLDNPEEITSEFDLTEEEMAELKKIDFSELEAVDNELEERLSKSFINLPEFSDEEDFHSSHINHTNDHTSHGSHDDDEGEGGGW